MTERTSLEIATEARSKIGAEVERLNSMTVQELASFLHEQGVRGIPHDADGCPLSRYFKRLFDHEYQVKVFGHAVEAYVPNFGDVPVYFNEHTTMAKFIVAFDNGGYESLHPESTTPASPKPGQDVT